jgi:predicted nucleotide-binding protein (sugar kinase/HSP70/actin superfamily)
MAIDLDRDSILSPVIHFKLDQASLAVELADQLSDRLGRSGSEIKRALIYAMERQDRFTNELQKRGRSIMDSHDPKEPLLVVTGRPYNLYDERLNLRLGRNLSKRGVTAVPMDFFNIDREDLSDFPNMYWGSGARILKTAKFIKRNPNYFGLHLTNFSCGADSFIEHFYKHIMGDQPYLILELDEHSAVAGVMTRLEAYKNVIDNSMRKQAMRLPDDLLIAN